jgi:hypothetical protein
MTTDHVFIMQCVVTICMIGISTALIFFPPNDASFTIGIAMLSSITGYWFPNPNRKQQNSSNSDNSCETETGTETDSNSDNADTNSNNFTSDAENDLDLANRNDTNDDLDDDPHSVHINIGDDNTTKPKRMKGVSSSVMETVSRMESEGVSYVHVDGQSHQQNKRNKKDDVSSAENNDESDGVNDAHIAV